MQHTIFGGIRYKTHIQTIGFALPIQSGVYIAKSTRLRLIILHEN